MTGLRWFCASGLALVLLGCAPAPEPVRPTLDYDPAADPFAQLAAASAVASAEDKHILLVAGGDWCIWCYYLEAFLADNAEIAAAYYDTFVVVHVNFSSDNRNEEFFGRLPEAPGYPHFWVLDAAGELLESQGTAVLEDGDKSYDRRVFMAFIERWQATLPG